MMHCVVFQPLVQSCPNLLFHIRSQRCLTQFSRGRRPASSRLASVLAGASQNNVRPHKHRHPRQFALLQSFGVVRAASQKHRADWRVRGLAIRSSEVHSPAHPMHRVCHLCNILEPYRFRACVYQSNPVAVSNKSVEPFMHIAVGRVQPDAPLPLARKAINARTPIFASMEHWPCRWVKVKHAETLRHRWRRIPLVAVVRAWASAWVCGRATNPHLSHAPRSLRTNFIARRRTIAEQVEDYVCCHCTIRCRSKCGLTRHSSRPSTAAQFPR